MIGTRDLYDENRWLKNQGERQNWRHGANNVIHADDLEVHAEYIADYLTIQQNESVWKGRRENLLPCKTCISPDLDLKFYNRDMYI